MDLSIVIPSIRTENWKDLIDSIEKSCQEFSYEIIFVGPKYNSYIDRFKSIKYVRDFGNPNRCQQIGMLIAEGDFVTWGSDDCMYTEGGIDQCMGIASLCDDDTVLVANYNEGGNIAVNNFSLSSNYPGCPHIKREWVIFNVAFMKRSLFERLGGFDCSFEATCIGHADLAARCQQIGCSVKIQNIKLLDCSHMPECTGDHAPIHIAQTTRDMPKYINKYSSEIFPTTTIMSNNWKQQQTVWEERFCE